MIKLIQRKTDNKYLKSVETDTWVDDIKEAFEMTYKEYNTSKETLLNTYTEEQLKVIVNIKKSKSITKEEREELINLLKK
jgi:zona occludens toxin (predicted ATPase)